MRLALTLAIGLLFCTAVSYSQTAEWVKTVGGPQTQVGTASAIDVNGNLYVTGPLMGTNIDFDPGPGTFPLSSVGARDGYVAKYDKNGLFKWAFRFGGASQDEAYGIAVDALGNLYITGHFRGANVDFDPGPGTDLLTSKGEQGDDYGYGGDIFLAKYDTLGNHKWAFGIGSTQMGDDAVSVEVDGNNDVYITGYFRETPDFDPGAATVALNAASGTAFLAKYSGNKTLLWAMNFGAPNTDNSGYGIGFDRNNNVYLSGYFQGSNIDMDPSAAVNAVSTNGGADIVVAKYTSAGQYIWAKSMGGGGWGREL